MPGRTVLTVLAILSVSTAAVRVSAEEPAEKPATVIGVNVAYPRQVAWNAGLRTGDIILTYAGQAMTNTGDLWRLRKQLAEDHGRHKAHPMRIRRFDEAGAASELTIEIPPMDWRVELESIPAQDAAKFASFGPQRIEVEKCCARHCRAAQKRDIKTAVEEGEKGIELAMKIGYTRRAATLLSNNSEFYFHLKRPEDAVRCGRLAEKIYEQKGITGGVVSAISNVGRGLTQLGRYEEAVIQFRRALDLAAGFKEPKYEAAVLKWVTDLYMRMGRWEDALELSESAVKAEKASRSAKGTIQALLVLGNIQGRTGRFVNCLASRQEALETAKRTRQFQFVPEATAMVGNALLKLSRFEEAIDTLKAAQALGQRARDLKLEMSALTDEGTAWSQMGHSRKALDRYEAALAISRRIGFKAAEEGLNANIGAVLGLMGEYEQAVAKIEKALESAKRYGDRHYEATCLGNLGEMFRALGKVEEGLAYQMKAVEILEDLGDTFVAANMRASIGGAHLARGRYEQGVREIEKALYQARQSQNRKLEAQILQQMSCIEERRGNPAKALAHIEKAIAIEKDFGIVTPAVYSTRAIMAARLAGPQGSPKWRASLLCLTGNSLEAVREVLTREGPDIAVQKNLPRMEQVVDLAWSEKGAPSSKKALEQALDTAAWADALPPAVRKAANASPLCGKTALEAGYQIIERLRAQGFLWEMQKRSVDLSADVPPEKLAARTRALGRINAIRADLLSLGSGKAAFDLDGKPLTAEGRKAEMEEKRKDLERCKEDLRKAERAIAAASPALAALQGSEAPALAELQSVLKPDELYLQFVLTGQKAAVHRVHLLGKDDQDVQELRRVEQQGSGNAYLLAVTSGDATVHVVGKTDGLQEQVELLRMTIEAQQWCEDVADFREQAAGLYAQLIAPALTALPDGGKAVKHLIISPDGALTRLPFDALLTQAAEDAERFEELPYLCLAFGTECTPSATAFVQGRKGAFRRGDPGNLFVALADPDYGKGIREDGLRSAGVLSSVLGGSGRASRERTSLREKLMARLSPAVRESVGKAQGTRGGVLGRLPGTRREVAAIAPLFDQAWKETAAVTDADAAVPEKTGGALVFFGPGAREEKARKAQTLSRAGVIHIACHGIADDMSPADASLILSTEGLRPGEDGFLSAVEIMELRTNARLVVCSACETGLGKVVRGEGVQGLTRAWQFAGARTVVVSLWRVEDRATSEFMKHFYAALTGDERDSASRSLAMARRAMVDSGEFAAPVYWAAFNAHGER